MDLHYAISVHVLLWLYSCKEQSLKILEIHDQASHYYILPLLSEIMT